jgi:uroporphyrinogen decarboxylase
MNKRERVLQLVHAPTPPAYVPAAFFLHFDPADHAGAAAVQKHLEFFRYTGMDFVKVQYEQTLPPPPRPLLTPADWAAAPLYPSEFFEPPAAVARGLVAAAKAEALVVMTLYSPYMWARRLAGEAALSAHLRADPEAVKRGLEIVTENVLHLVRACKQAGVDGFYASTQGGEAGHYTGTDIFERYIKPTDLAVWAEIGDCTFNILHVCDYEGGYDDLTPFLDYGGHVVNCSLKLGDRRLRPAEAAQMFGRPFMGGLERLGRLATGTPEDARRAAAEALAAAPARFILAADCTVPGDTPWENLKAAIDAAHRYRETA